MSWMNAMSMKCRRWLLPTAAMLLAFCPPLAWGQSTRTWEELSGGWCDADRGCTDWWNHYVVLVRGEKVFIRYGRDEAVFVFVGDIQAEVPKWTITGTIKRSKEDGGGEHKFDGTVNEFETTKGTIEAQVTGKLKTKVEGSQIEVTVPFKTTSDTVVIATFEEKERVDDEGEDDEGGRGKKKIEGVVKGKIKGKLKTAAGVDDTTLEGTFEGKFKGKLTVPVNGFYIVPPFLCSEAGRPLAADERKLREDAVLAGRTGILEVRPGRFVSRKDQEQREVAAKLREEAKKLYAERPFAAESQKAVAEWLAGLLHTQGRFVRKVKGTVSITAPHTITLELPPLPVLDHTCTVRDEVAKRTLKLVKQHDAAK